MNNWEDSFRKGVVAYRGSQFDEALLYFNEAIANGGQQYNVYDSRAATFEKLGKIKEALRDSRKVIDIAPEMRQGYLRAAKLFFDLKKYDAADQIIQVGLSTLPSAKRTALETLQGTIRKARDWKQFSLFSKLPVEIVMQIFDDLVKWDPLFPIVLSLVSSQWRTFVLSKPFYWQYLVLSKCDPINKAEQWLGRSGHCVRHLVVRENISFRQLNLCLKKFGPPLFKTLRSFRAEFGFDSNLCQYFPSGTLPCQDLEELQVCLNYGNDSKFIQAIIPPFDNPHLHTLVVERTGLDWSTMFPRTTSLRKLVIRHTNVNLDIIDVLKGNSQLSVLILEGLRDLTETPDVPALHHTLEMPSLVQLELRGAMELVRFISLVTFPALQHLEFSGTFSRLNNVFSYFEPVPTGLTQLHIRNCSFDTERILTLISKLSKLENLTVTRHGGDMNSIVDLVAGSPESRHFLHPCLNQVNFSHSPCLTGGPIIRLIKGRLMAEEDIAKIKAVIIDGCHQIDPSVPEWLKSRVEKVSCVYMSKKDKYRREWA